MEVGGGHGGKRLAGVQAGVGLPDVRPITDGARSRLAEEAELDDRGDGVGGVDRRECGEASQMEAAPEGGQPRALVEVAH